eukprot:52376_1
MLTASQKRLLVTANTLKLPIFHTSTFTSDSKIQQNKMYTYNFAGVSSKPSKLIRNAFIDTSVWNHVDLVDSDIYINTPAKAGTTWTSEIVAQILYNGQYESILELESVWEVSIWPALSVMKEVSANILSEQLKNDKIQRRIIKTHEPIESIPFNPVSKYIFVGRDYRDIVWSIHNHFSLFADDMYDKLNADREYKFTKVPTFNFDIFTEYDLWNMMLNEPQPDDGTIDGFPWWSQLWVAGSWWNVRNLQNVKLIHYNNLKEDLPENMRAIAEFLELEIDENNFDNLVKNCSIEIMRNKKEPLGAMGEQFLTDAKKFFHKGENKRWENILTDEDIEKYRNLAKVYLDDDGIHWLETGKFN